ncbi:MAG TPA: hypothetical protein VGE94_01550 [Chloroflexota bacterium]
MPYPESCPECGGAFRNTGTHFTARRNEIGRHVLLELGCQNTSRRFWWDFTTGSITEDGRTVPARRAASLAASLSASSNGALHDQHNGHNGHITLSTLDRPEPEPELTIRLDIEPEREPEAEAEPEPEPEAEPPTEVSIDALSDSNNRLQEAMASLGAALTGDPESVADTADTSLSEVAIDLAGPMPAVAPALKDAFVRQLQLDRLTLRQMRSWLMSDEARRAIEVAAGATEATYERLALILFGSDLPQLLGKQAAAPASTGMSAEERLELQREKARIRARLRRAAAKNARTSS